MIPEVVPPGTTPRRPVDQADPTTCELCGKPCDADPTVYDAAGFDICTQCLEDML